MSKRFGRNQKRKLREQNKEAQQKVDWIMSDLQEARRQHRYAESQRELMAQELANCLERSLRPRLTVLNDHIRHRKLGVHASIENDRQAQLVAQDISMEAIYMLSGPNAKEQMALLLGKEFVRVLAVGGGARINQ